MRHSIIRRSAAVTIAFLIGHAFNYALILVANRILAPGDFGIFYTAILVITVMVSPMIAVTLVLARVFAGVGAERGQAHVAIMTWRVLGQCVRWGVPIAAVAGLAFALAGPSLGIESWPIMLLIPAAVVALIIPEVLRASFQSLLLFGWASAVWIVSQGTQFVLAIAALLLVGQVWAGIAGLLLAAAFTSVVFSPWFARAARAERGLSDLPASEINLVAELPMILSYSFFILFTNIDLLAAYWLLPRSALDIYAASALLPKAIATASFPVAQVVLPVIVKQSVGGFSYRLSILKAVAMVAGMSALAACVLWFGVPILQTTRFAIRGLDFPVMMVLAIGAIGLSTIRVLIVVEISIERYAMGLAQAGVVALFVILSIWIDARVYGIAAIYTAVSWGFLFLTLAVVFLMFRTMFSNQIGSQER